jgi:hypothetical protein
MTDLGPAAAGYERVTWFGIGVPKYTPIEINERLNDEVNASWPSPGQKLSSQNG